MIHNNNILTTCFQHHTVGALQRLEQTLTANAMSNLVSLANHISDITAPAYFSLLNSASPSGGSSVIVTSHGVLHDLILLI